MQLAKLDEIKVLLDMAGVVSDFRDRAVIIMLNKEQLSAAIDVQCKLLQSLMFSFQELSSMVANKTLDGFGIAPTIDLASDPQMHILSEVFGTRLEALASGSIRVVDTPDGKTLVGNLR